MKSIYSLLVLTLLSGASARAETITSDYTPLTGPGCTVTASSETDPNAEIDYFDSECSGRAGYRVFHNGGDLRSWLEFKVGTAANFRVQGGIKTSLPITFAYVAGSKLEWRSTVSGGKTEPFAIIYRVAGQDESDMKHFRDVQFLQIAKLTKTGACVVGTVYATGNPTANLEARIIADRDARAATCPAESQE